MLKIGFGFQVSGFSNRSGFIQTALKRDRINVTFKYKFHFYKNEITPIMIKSFPKIPEKVRLQKLIPPKGKVRMVLDTDTYNEIDDQFAVVYSLLSPEKLDVEAIYAAPFFNEKSDSPGDGMEKSYKEILRLLKKMERTSDNFVFRGSENFLSGYENPRKSPAATDLIKKAMLQKEKPLYVAAIGAISYEINLYKFVLPERQIYYSPWQRPENYIIPNMFPEGEPQC